MAGEQTSTERVLVVLGGTLMAVAGGWWVTWGGVVAATDPPQSRPFWIAVTWFSVTAFILGIILLALGEIGIPRRRPGRRGATPEFAVEVDHWTLLGTVVSPAARDRKHRDGTFDFDILNVGATQVLSLMVRRVTVDGRDSRLTQTPGGGPEMSIGSWTVPWLPENQELARVPQGARKSVRLFSARVPSRAGLSAITCPHVGGSKLFYASLPKEGPDWVLLAFACTVRAEGQEEEFEFEITFIVSPEHESALRVHEVSTPSGVLTYDPLPVSPSDVAGGSPSTDPGLTRGSRGD